MINISTLYEAYDTISESFEAKKNISEISVHYETILKAVKYGPQEKKLASQFIVRFFTNFPAHKVEAFNAMIDLLEDEDLLIRSTALNDLISICKKDKEYVTRVADTCAQLLAAEGDKMVIGRAIAQLSQIDFKMTMDGFLSQLFVSFERTKDIIGTFFAQKMPTILRDCGNSNESSEFLVEKLQKIICDSSVPQATFCLKLMNKLAILNLKNRKNLFESVLGIFSSTNNSSPTDQEIMEMAELVKSSSFLFSKNLKSNQIAEFFVPLILPKLIGSEISQQMHLLMPFADSTAYCDSDLLKNSPSVLKTALNLLLKSILRAIGSKNSEESENVHCLSSEDSTVCFEALLTVFHRFGKLGLLPTDGNAIFNQIMTRVQHVGLLAQNEINKARGTDGKDRLRSLNNIKLIVRDLIHCPPVFNITVESSWAIPCIEIASGNSDKPIPPLKRVAGDVEQRPSLRRKSFGFQGRFNKSVFYRSSAR